MACATGRRGSDDSDVSLAIRGYVLGAIVMLPFKVGYLDKECVTELERRRRGLCARRGKIEVYEGGDTVSTEAVAARRHAGTHLPVTWWKLEMPTTTWHLLLN